MGLFGTVGDIAKQISKTTPFSFDGLGSALKFNADDVARSYASREGVRLAKDTKSMKASLEKMTQGTKQYNDLAGKIAKSEGQFSSIVEAHKAGTADAVNSAFKDITGKDKIGVMATLDGYFGDKRYGSTRKKVALGTGAATAVGVRYLSGGNMTTNNTGERDIVGIPFI